jgi:hypothetical protein
MPAPGMQSERFFDAAEYARRHTAVRAATQAAGADLLLGFAYSKYQVVVFPLYREPLQRSKREFFFRWAPRHRKPFLAQAPKHQAPKHLQLETRYD